MFLMKIFNFFDNDCETFFHNYDLTLLYSAYSDKDTTSEIFFLFFKLQNSHSKLSLLL